MPRIINSYASLIFRVAILTLALYVVIQFMISIHRDLSNKQITMNQRMESENRRCQQEYIENRCDERVPALKEFCEEREACLNRNPLVENRSVKILAHLIAETINDLMEPLSYKVICVVVLFLVLILFVDCVIPKRQRKP